MNFEMAYQKFMEQHIADSNGERRGRLLSRNYHGEKLFLSNVWWKLVGNLDYLHPEYEIMDWRGRSYFADFAWLPPGNHRMLIEIKSYSYHVRDLDRDGYCRELNRELFNLGMGYQVISFPYDDIANRPELSLTLLRMIVNQFVPRTTSLTINSLAENEIIRLAYHRAGSVRLIDVVQHLQMDRRQAAKLLHSLVEHKQLIAIKGEKQSRIIKYVVPQDKV
ncbi:MAG: hypothetical protein P0Y55_12375 [Candidatus Cohnella colombiensis]|uniref:DUF559 domain-containing protein n=1 Tax=Candidatus Cohnella colombiensis TaxID=3121368 RepID=A0AA95J9J4_9BACL|nr:MAG: hypothetical protein P0Y55_12375 [Cohnella sp.]